jgi:hypothetical protein
MDDVVSYNVKFLSKSQCFYSHSKCILSNRMLFTHTSDCDLILTRARIFSHVQPFYEQAVSDKDP